MKRILNIHIGMLLALVVWSCTDDFFSDGGVPTGTVNMTTYDYLVSHDDSFGEVVKIIDRAGVKDSVNKQGVTFFAPQNQSVSNYLALQGADAVEDIDPATLKDLVLKYMVENRIKRADLSTAPEQLTSLGAHEMKVSVVIDKWKGVQNIGPKFMMLEVDGNETMITTADLESTTGVVHILEGINHVFGF